MIISCQKSANRWPNKYKLKKGIILTSDQEEEINEENKKIIVKPVWKWLLEDR